MKQIFSLLILLYAAVGLSQSSPDTALLREKLQMAESHFNERNYELALTSVLGVKKTLEKTSNDPDHPLWADITRLLGSIYVRQNKLPEAHRQLDRSAERYMQHNPIPWGELAAVYSNKGVAYAFAGAYASGLEWFEKALSAITRSSESDQSLKTAEYLGNLGMAHYYLNHFEEAETYFLRALEQFESSEAATWSQYGLMEYRLGLIAQRKGNPALALVHYQTALNDYKKRYGEKLPIVADLYASMASLHLQQGNFSPAITYSERGSQLYRELKGDDSPEYLQALYPKIEALYSLGQVDEAMELDNGVLAALQRIYRGQAHHFRIAVQLAEIGIKQREILGNTSTCIDHLSRAIRWLEKSSAPVEEEIARYTMNLGLAYQQEKRYQAAEQMLLRSLELHRDLYGSTAAYLFLPYRNLAALYGELGRMTEALKYYELAETAAGLRQGATVNTLAYPFFVASALGEKAQLFAEKYRQEGRDKDRRLADSLFQQSLTWFEAVQRKGDQQSQISLQKRIEPVLENWLDLCWQQYKEEPRPNLQSKIFQLMERGKNFVLYQNVLQTKVERFAGIPDTLLQKERKLQADIAFYEKEQFQAAQNEDSRKNHSTLLFGLTVEYQDLKEQLATEYPDYYRLRYASPAPELADIQQQLGEAQQLIEYFVGAKALYIFSVTPDAVVVRRLAKDASLEEALNRFRREILRKSEHFGRDAYELYQKLLAPLDDLRQHLIIIPDASLSALPFETLLREKPEVDIRYSQQDYLLYQHAISYNFSAALWAEMCSREYPPTRLLAVAPSFSPTSKVEGRRQEQLGELVFNQAEVQQIGEQFPARILLDTAATLRNFLHSAEKADHLHLATHAKLNDRVGEYSYLAFYGSNDSTQNSRLYLRDLYNLRLPLNLAVLSACETSMGQLRKGEGMMSLARGFTYAGAKSLVSSLWTVNDLSTARLMTTFYENLRSGMPKDEALRSAKLALLQDGTIAHPYYWAAFIATGDMEPLPSARPTFSRLFVSGIVLLAALFFLFFQKRSKKR